MPKHKSEDYKITAVKYYLENDTTYAETCRIFKCSERSLKRWIERYKKDKSIKRYDRKSISYKITKEQVKYAIKKLKENQQITMNELVKIIKKKYKNFDITPQWLGKVIRDNNITRKRTRHKHFPKIRYGKKINKIMNDSAISLNILRDQNHSSHNMKSFEIPSNNGLMLTTRSQEQSFFFKENVCCYMYSSKKELNKKIRFILRNPKRAEIVRKNGFKQVKKHSYINRVKEFIKKINVYK